MELWIRSKNRERIIKVNQLSLNYNIEVTYGGYKPDYSDTTIIANDNYKLGTYKTKERALEVLDDIQEQMDMDFSVSGYTIYEMPTD